MDPAGPLLYTVSFFFTVNTLSFFLSFPPFPSFPIFHYTPYITTTACHRHVCLLLNSLSFIPACFFFFFATVYAMTYVNFPESSLVFFFSFPNSSIKQQQQ
ncbi:hypothetical protein STCU_10602 [Strigomonas culicis]|uniref:Uncharacterized protein n=1 Tax=Strigomonas culicis TaxID=28005 RepID=S9US87_9TRYP|nr:hypothetical protein STCU_10602 [Strigomonas culicis]|eukprot:EPY17451.1 hypothetical protein STCU_10602 [Strigomonas culicis]